MFDHVLYSISIRLFRFAKNFNSCKLVKPVLHRLGGFAV